MSCKTSEHDFDITWVAADSAKGIPAEEVRRKCNRCGVVRVELTPEEHALVLEALDSHAYWQVSSECYRDNGYIYAPGANEPEEREALKAVDRLSVKLGGEPVTFDEEQL